MKKNRSFKKLIPWLLIILWMAVIYRFSAEEGTVSGGRSKNIAKAVQQTVKLLPDSLKSGRQGVNTIEFVIRKSGHVLEYFVLSLLILTAIARNKKYKKLAYILAFLIPMIYAILDEYHQTFIPWRDGKLSDVFIDGAGVVLGIFTYTIVVHIRRNRNKRDRQVM